jgi:hypothetical protein
VLHAEESAEHIGVEHGGVAFLRLLGHGTRMTLGAGIVDGNIEPAKALHGLVHKNAHLIVMAHVGADELRLSPLRAELLGKLLAGLAVAS